MPDSVAAWRVLARRTGGGLRTMLPRRPGRHWTTIEPLESRTLLASVVAEAQPLAAPRNPLPARQVEQLNRGVVAVRTSSSSVYVGWRMLASDPSDIAFNLYVSINNGPATKVNASPITQSTNYSHTGQTLTQARSYFVRPVISGVEQPPSESFTLPANAPVQQYLNVPLQVPPGGTTPADESYTYNANDASVGDLNGDGDYEIVLKWDPSNSKDNSQSGYTGNVYIDAYDFDGQGNSTLLWRIDLGRNIRAGAHYTQFIVYDLDGDGKAEIAMKTAPGTIDGLGNPVLMGSDTASADYRNSSGYILTGPEYLTVFDGLTGANRATIAYQPARGSVTQWGDSYGNRVDRFTAAVAYLDGQRPSLIMGRGYYGPQSSSGQARNEIAAYDFRNGQLTLRWHFKAGYNINGNINSNYIGQGPHGMSVADVDGDGKDEIIYGACAIDDNGAGLYSTGLGHGDAFHVSDLDPSRPGLEVFMVHESPGSYGNAGGEFRDARTGALIFGIPANNDVGRGVAADIDPNSTGAEMWATTTDPNGGPRYIYSAAGQPLYETPGNMFYNFVVWWDADPSRELLDGTTISDWLNPGRSNFDLDPNTSGVQQYAPNASSNNGTKSTPALSADLFGDWREEVIWRRSDNTALMIFTTIIPASFRTYTLMHDTQYRVAIAWQNGAYNQPPHPSFYLGAMDAGGSFPTIPAANVYYPDLTAPSVLEAAYVYAQNPHKLSVRFSEDVSASLSASDLLITPVAGGAGIAASAVSWKAATFTATFTLPVLANANYHARLLPGSVFDSSNNALPSEGLSLDFFVLAGDVNRDRTVDISDLSIIATHWQGTGKTFADGDLNSDGIVDISDLSIVATNWQQTLPPTIQRASRPAARPISRPAARVADEILSASTDPGSMRD